MIRHALACALLLGSLGSLACGGSRPAGAAVSSPFTPRDEQLFADGLDLLSDPESLEGQWRRDWERDTSERIDRADLVVEGVLATVSVDSDPEQRTHYRLGLRVQRVHAGHVRGKEITLHSREGSPGYASIASQQRDILEKPFIAFVKYVEAPGRPIARFHMTPPSPALKAALVRLERDDSHSLTRRITQSN